MRFDECLKFTLKWEGGYVNDPDDPGGATNYGITQASYDAYRKRFKLQLRSVKEIELKEIQPFYLGYWNNSKAGAFDLPLAMVMFDTAVNFGAGRAMQFLNQALKLGNARSATKATLTSIDHLKRDPAKQRAIAVQICNTRIAFRYRRVDDDPKQKKFLRGWLRRDRALLSAISK